MLYDHNLEPGRARAGDRPAGAGLHDPDDAPGGRRPAPARGRAIPGYDLAGKTGTTSDYRDAWFIGYTGGFVAAVWTGRDDNTPMRRVTGGGAPAEIWRAFMAASLPRLDVQPIPGGAAPPAARPATRSATSSTRRDGSGASRRAHRPSGRRRRRRPAPLRRSRRRG